MTFEESGRVLDGLSLVSDGGHPVWIALTSQCGRRNISVPNPVAAQESNASGPSFAGNGPEAREAGRSPGLRRDPRPSLHQYPFPLGRGGIHIADRMDLVPAVVPI